MRFPRKFLSSSRQRQRRIDRIFRNLAEFFLIAYVVFVIAALLSSYPSFRIAEVSVRGARTIDVQTVMATAHKVLEKKLLWKIERGNALLLPKNALIAAVKHADNRIESVTITVPSARNVVIDINEYVPAFIWCPQQVDDRAVQKAEQSEDWIVAPVCYFADEHGFIFDDAPRFSGTTLRVYRTEITAPGSPIGQHILPHGTFVVLERMAAELEASGVSVYAIDALGDGDYRFTVNAPWTLLWSDTKDPKASAENLALVIERLRESGEDLTKISTIDLRFGDKVFYKQ